MRLLVQKVSRAEVYIERKLYSSIGNGMLVLIGISASDTSASIPKLAKKLLELRIFPDAAGKMNLSVQDVQASLLIVSQFTLYADCRKGRRPDFTKAASPKTAELLYENFIAEVKKSGLEVQTGIFGAMMRISLVNEGPVTLMLDSDEL